MSQRIRTLFFWLHLTAGLVAGAVVLVMSVTGVLLTYEKQMVWSADTRHLTVAGDASTPRLPIDELLAEPGTEAELAERLRLAASVRSFARELGLDVGEQYTSYVDWPGDRVVTSVVATRPGEVTVYGEPTTGCIVTPTLPGSGSAR